MSIPAAKKALKEYFGYDSFHPTQEKAISSIFDKQDTLVLMPTGGGKSICYQIPAIVLEGVTIVVSPLIALMKDQVDGLKANGIQAEFLNSSQDPNDQSDIIQRLLQNEIKLLYVSAEKLVSPDFGRLLSKIKVSLFAIDEAHCISAWGHDFRPEYTQLSYLKKNYPNVPIIALTATADKTTREDIQKQLGLDEINLLIDSFDRPNISLEVRPGKKRIEQIIEFLQNHPNQPGIIYCLSRKQTEQVAEKIMQSGINAAAYHAGLTKPNRSTIQQSFVRDKTQIICATIAFGMGIDKSNVRWVIHYNLPKNIEGYYQEIGRSGRDGAPAKALLFYSYRDVETLKRFALDAGQKDLQLAKLDRIKEYAEGTICRRKILMEYFGENHSGDCNSCDVCKNPYATIDTTSDIHLALNTLQPTQSNFTKDELVSYLSNTSSPGFAQWHFFIAQLRNLGLIKTLHQQNNKLVLTPAGQEILSSKAQVNLVDLNHFIEQQDAFAKSIKSIKNIKSKSSFKPNKEAYDNPLFDALRKERLNIARNKNIAAYMVFSDKTLLQMAEERPTNQDEMLAVSGVGQTKWEAYGRQFLEVIAEY